MIPEAEIVGKTCYFQDCGGPIYFYSCSEWKQRYVTFCWRGNFSQRMGSPYMSPSIISTCSHLLGRIPGILLALAKNKRLSLSVFCFPQEREKSFQCMSEDVKILWGLSESLPCITLPMKNIRFVLIDVAGTLAFYKTILRTKPTLLSMTQEVTFQLSFLPSLSL